MVWGDNSQPELNAARMRDPSLTTGRDMPYEALLSTLRVGLYTCNIQGNITFFDERAEGLWGYRPSTDVRFWAFHKSWQPDGQEILPDNSPMAVAIREGRTFHGPEMWVVEPDGNRCLGVCSVDPSRYVIDTVVCAAVRVRVFIHDRVATTGFITHSERRDRP